MCNLNAIRGDDCTLTYMAAALTVGYLTGASVVALHLGAANWSGHTYQLVVPAAVAVITATIAAACYVLHFVLDRRQSKKVEDTAGSRNAAVTSTSKPSRSSSDSEWSLRWPGL